MVRIVVPDAWAAERLAAIACAAFERAGAGIWNAADFVSLGAPPRAALIVDDAFRDALLILRMAGPEAEILNFGVVPAARRRGHGRALLAGAEGLCAAYGVEAIFLEVAVDNGAALALYASAGYRTVGRRVAYYRRPGGECIDALVLRRAVGAGREASPG